MYPAYGFNAAHLPLISWPEPTNKIDTNGVIVEVTPLKGKIRDSGASALLD